MFRGMRRFKQQLTEQECAEVLAKAPRGVLAVHGENGYPYALPLNFIYLDGKIYFHGAREGHKIDAMQADDKVSFCVMDEGFIKDGDWALNIKSVVIFGRVKAVSDSEKGIEALRRLGQKYYPTKESVDEEIRKAGARTHMLALSIDHMTGKLVHEK